MKTQEEHRTPAAGAGKPSLPVLRVVARGIWRGGEGKGEDGERWMGAVGQAMVRAGRVAWGEAGRVEEGWAGVGERRRGVVGVGLGGEWLEWLKGKEPATLATQWRSQPPLWLLGCLPNLPAARLAVEIGAKGPVETLRPGKGAWEEAEDRARRWIARGVEYVLLVQAVTGGADAVVLAAERGK